MTQAFLKKFINSVISIKGLIIFSILLIFFYMFLLPRMPYPSIIPDALFFYTADDLFNIFSNYSLIERENYIHASHLFDILYPIIYTIFLFIPLSLLSKKNEFTKFLKIINFSPFIAFFSDIIENNLIIYNLKHFEHFNFKLAQITGYFTLIKWTFIYLSLILIVVYFCIFIFFRLKNKKK